mgnify:CR=1 FL=1
MEKFNLTNNSKIKFNDLSQIIEKVKVSMEIEGPIYESTSMPSKMLNVPFILKIYMVEYASSKP